MFTGHAESCAVPRVGVVRQCFRRPPYETVQQMRIIIIIIIIDNFCIALFSGVPKLTALYNILQHFISFTNIIYIIMTTNNV